MDDPDVQAINQMASSSMTSPQPLPGDPDVQAITSMKKQVPDDVSRAQEVVGQPLDEGFCQAFVEMATKSREHYPSAADAWNAQLPKAKGGLGGIQPGDVVYFAPDSSNQNFGHTGIYAGNNQFVSATYNGVEVKDLIDWQRETGQQILGYIPKGGSND